MDEFSDDLTIARKEYERRWALQHAAYYCVTADSGHPRYATPVARLQQSLKDLPLAASDFSCSR